MATSKYGQFRKKMTFTQEYVAQKLSIDKSTVSKWESGTSSPRADMLPKLAQLYNCTIDDLLASSEQKQRKNERR